MKILLINKFLYPKGGDAICTLATGDLLSHNGHEVVYWGMDHPKNQQYPHKQYFVTCVDYNKPSGWRQKVKSTLNILYSFESKNKFDRVLPEIQPDIVHLNNFAHQISPSILTVIKKWDVPTVMTMHDYKLVCPAYTLLSNGNVCEKCKDGKYYRCLLNKCTHNSRAKSFVNVVEMYLHHKVLHIYDLIDVFISPSAFLKNKLQEMGFTHEIVHLPNFVDLGEHSPRYNSQQRSIVYFGRLSFEKGLSTLLDAVKGLDIKLNIIGDGTLRRELEEKVAREEIANVGFVGYKSGQELQKTVKNALATVTPSECYENNPRTVIESFALGKPVIGAKIGGIPELVQDGITGYTFEPGNSDDLRSKINLLTKDPDKTIEMGKAARKHVVENNNPEKHYYKLIDIYNRAIKNKK